MKYVLFIVALTACSTTNNDRVILGKEVGKPIGHYIYCFKKENEKDVMCAK